MKSKSQFTRKCLSTVTTLALAALVTTPAAAQTGTYKVILQFTGNSGNGSTPLGDLISDASGNLYGTARSGGNYTDNCLDPTGCGTVFELSPTSSGGWTSQVIYKFNGGNDGAYPWAGLTFDPAGNLYGTTDGGGGSNLGTVYELSPAVGGGWTEKVLYSFQGGSDGMAATSKLIIDPAGNLYGTTAYDCCATEGGVIFELSPSSGGSWTFTTLYSFTLGGIDGSTPVAGLIRDAAGNLYGTALQGGNSHCTANSGNCGTVFELSPDSSGGWTYTALHAFRGTDGAAPRASLLLDSAGNLYGTTSLGGDIVPDFSGCGVIFKLSPNSSGGWTEVLLRVLPATTGCGTFSGYQPYSDVVFDGAGNLYGTTLYGGTGYGVVYKLSPRTTGGWKETVVHAFSNASEAGDRLGLYPQAGVLIDAAGHIFGTTSGGGTGNGVVFEITP
jgi:uncharacterized repeat protein (TIGR03803 family)